MFGGKTAAVKMRFSNRLAGVVLDRFGADTMLIPDGQDHFTFTMEIAVSPPFFAWLASFGDGAKILSPDWVVRDFVALCRAALAQYDP